MKNNHGRATRAERLLHVLGNRGWHSTAELIRRVSHTFAGAKWRLVRAGYRIARTPHPRNQREHFYRLVASRSGRRSDGRHLTQPRRPTSFR